MPTFSDFLKNRNGEEQAFRQLGKSFSSIVEEETGTKGFKAPKLDITPINKATKFLSSFKDGLVQSFGGARKEFRERGKLRGSIDSARGVLKGFLKEGAKLAGGALSIGAELAARGPVLDPFIKDKSVFQSARDIQRRQEVINRVADETFVPSGKLEEFTGMLGQGVAAGIPTSRLGVLRTIVPDFALMKLSGATDEEAVIGTLFGAGSVAAFKGVFATGKAIKEIPQTIRQAADDLAISEGRFGDVSPAGASRLAGGEVPKIDPLIEEARKFDTAEEFLDSLSEKEVFHGGRIESLDDFDPMFKGATGRSNDPLSNLGINLSDKQTAEYFSARGGGRIAGGIPTPNKVKKTTYNKLLHEIADRMEDRSGVGFGSQIRSLKTTAEKNNFLIDNLADPSISKELAEDLLRDGFDAIEYRNTLDGGTTFIPLKKDAIKTKQQLTDIWKKAQEAPATDIAPVKAGPLIEEARKFETAEEFQKALDKGGNAKKVLNSIRRSFDSPEEFNKFLKDSLDGDASVENLWNKAQAIEPTSVKQKKEATLESVPKEISKSLEAKETIKRVSQSSEPRIREALEETKQVETDLQFPSTRFIPQKRIARKLIKRKTGQVVKDTKKVLNRKFQFDVDSASDLKDIGLLGKNFRDVYRNFEQVFEGKNFEKVRKEVLDPFDASKGRHIDMQQKLLDDLDSVIVKGLGIGKGSNLSRLVQEFGEKLKTSDDVIKEVGKEKASRVFKAEQWFRAQYDELLEDVNAVRRAIYPNDPTKIIPKRKDYFRHFTDLRGLGGLKSLFESPSGIDPKLVGVSDFTKPNSKFLNFAQKRLGFKTDLDAVGGYLDYIPSASYAINVDPQIRVFRKLASDLADQTQNKKNLNNFIEFLQDFSNDLAGKTNPFDRSLQKLIGRKLFKIINWLNSRVKLNVILGNISSSMAQVMNLPQGLGKAKGFALSGAKRALASVFEDSPAMKKSIFLKERYFDSHFSKFDTSILKYPKQLASWIITVGDELATKLTWNSLYEKGLKGLKMSEVDAVKYADDQTRKSVAGRGVGEVPIAQKSKLTQLIAPFQIEVGNGWWAMKDFVSKKDFAGITVTLLAGHLLNEWIKDVRGSNVSFDPIAALRDAAGEDKVLAQRIGRLVGEVVSNVPFGQSIAAQFFEKGKTIDVGGVKMTPQQLFGEGDPTRFGSGLLAAKGIQDPLFKLVLPFSGVQVKKSIEGARAVSEGKVTKKDGSLVGVIETPEDKIKALLFGKWSVSEAQKEFARLDKAAEKRAVVRKRVFDNEADAAIELEKKMREEGLISDKSFPFRDSIRSIHGFSGNITDEDNIQKLLRLPENTREAFISSYLSKTQKQIRKKIKSNPKYDRQKKIDRLKKIRKLQQLRDGL